MKRNRIGATVVAVAAMFATVALMTTTAVFAQTGPDEVVKSAATSVTTVLKSDPAILGNAAKLKELIESKLLPNFNFPRMTQLAMGRNWAKASPEQQTALTREFQTLLVRTYSGALSNFKNNTIDYKPLRMAAG